jgi:hypothetical protein
MKLRIENELERNVIAVALDHLEEHLRELNGEDGAKEQLQACRNLINRTLE